MVGVPDSGSLKDAEIVSESPLLTIPSVAGMPSIPLRVTVGAVLSTVNDPEAEAAAVVLPAKSLAVAAAMLILTGPSTAPAVTVTLRVNPLPVIVGVEAEPLIDTLPDARVIESAPL